MWSAGPGNTRPRAHTQPPTFSHSPLSDADRANLLVRISELFLQDNESVDAEIFLNRAHQYLAGTSDWVLQMRYNVRARTGASCEAHVSH